MSKLKKVSEWIISIFVIFVFIFSAIAMISVINGRKTGVNSIFGKVMTTVQSNSMEDTLFEGDLIFGNVYDGEVLQEGQIITYKLRVNDKTILNTHRIVTVEQIDGAYIYKTQGDHEKEADSGFRTSSEIVSVYNFRIPKVGFFIDWLKTPLGFIICVILPIVAVILYEAYKIVSVILKVKAETSVAATAEETSEDVKAEIIKQYLAAQKAAELANADNGEVTQDDAAPAEQNQENNISDTSEEGSDVIEAEHETALDDAPTDEAEMDNQDIAEDAVQDSADEAEASAEAENISPSDGEDAKSE